MKKIKDLGIERCDSPKDVKIFFHPASIKMWLTIAIMIIALAGSGAKTWDWFWYQLLKHPRNQEERIVKHMTFAHLFTGDIPVTEKAIDVRSGSKLVVREFKDACIVTCLIDQYGKPEGFKVHASEQTIATLAQKPVSIMKEVEAGYARRFSLGVHANDAGYRDNFGKHKGEILRVYKDGCLLSYMIDRYANTYNWYWLEYNHSRRNN